MQMQGLQQETYFGKVATSMENLYAEHMKKTETDQDAIDLWVHLLVLHQVN